MILFTFPHWDTELFKYINDSYVNWLDPVMVVLSSSASWFVLFLIVSYFMIRKSRFWGFREIFLITCTVAVNNIVNTLVKLVIKRPRPCGDSELQSVIRILEDCGSQYSFFSAHSSNAFCLAICTALFFRNKYYTVLMLIWATVVAYSRIYVGKHYPLDVICGITFGIVMSFAGNYFLRHYREIKIKDYYTNN